MSAPLPGLKALLGSIEAALPDYVAQHRPDLPVAVQGALVALGVQVLFSLEAAVHEHGSTGTAARKLVAEMIGLAKVPGTAAGT
jgi:hypothetical protein